MYEPGHKTYLLFIKLFHEDLTSLNKKFWQIFLMYKEKEKESGAKSYMKKGFLLYEEMH